MADGDVKERGLGSSLRKLSTLQQRFEASAVGKAVISGVILVIVLVGVAWNLPDSPIKRLVTPVAKPLAVPTGLDQGWAMYTPNPSTRIDTIEVQVTMADGENRIWTMQPGAAGISDFGWDRWLVMRFYAVLDASVRPDLARWVARQVTGPGERAVAVTMTLRTETLQAPDEPAQNGGRRSNATKVLYQENLAGQQ